MKIPASSSIILATLAISSSSGTLAAPTGNGDGSSDLYASQSSGQVSSTMMPGGMEEDGGEAPRVSERNLETRDPGMVSDILAGLPIVGPLAKALLVKDCPVPSDGASTQSSDVSQEEIARLQSAVDSVSDALNGILPISGAPVPLPSGALGEIGSMVPSPLQSVVAGMAVDGASAPGEPEGSDPTGIPGPAPSGDDGGPPDSPFLVSPTTTVAAAADETPADAPTSPGVPSGPPNTPAIPEPTPDPDYQAPDQETE